MAMSGHTKALFVVCATYLSSKSLVTAEEIIGFDGVEHNYPRAHHSQDLSEPKVHSVHRHHIAHMLNAGHSHHRHGPHAHSVKHAAHHPDAAAEFARLHKGPDFVKAPKEDLVAKAEEEEQLENSMEVLRAQLCVRRSKAGTQWHGHDHHKCDEFMNTKCGGGNEAKPGKAMRLACSNFFSTERRTREEEKEQEERAEEEAAKEADEEALAAAAPAPGPAGASPAAAPAAGPSAAEPIDVKLDVACSGQKTPGGLQPAGAPSASPCVSKSDLAAAESRLERTLMRKGRMSEDVKQKEQGFTGARVEHEDMKTGTSDWQGEYGHGKTSTLRAICVKYPDSEWCRVHGYHPTEPPLLSGSPAGQRFSLLVSSAAFAAALLRLP